GRRARGRRCADPQERPARLSQGSSPDRASPLPGCDLLAAVGGGAVAEHRGGQRSCGGLSSHRGTAAALAGPASRARPRLTGGGRRGRMDPSAGFAGRETRRLRGGGAWGWGGWASPPPPLTAPPTTPPP